MIGTRPFGTVLLASILVGVGALLLASTAHAYPITPAPKGVQVKERPADQHQREMAAVILDTCRAMKAPIKVRVTAIATATQESGIRNLRGGHGTSVGLFQIINIHGSVSQRRNPVWASRWFCSRAKNVNHHRPWLTITELSHAVQRSAHPNAVARWVGEARRTTRASERRTRTCLA